MLIRWFFNYCKFFHLRHERFIGPLQRALIVAPLPRARTQESKVQSPRRAVWRAERAFIRTSRILSNPCPPSFAAP